MTVLTAGDRIDLRDLVARYALHADRRDLHALGGLFAPDATLVLPDPPADLGPVRTHTGRDAIVRALSTLNDVPVTSHELAGEVFDAEGETATGHVACVAHHITEHEGKLTDLAWHLHYTDAYIRQDGTWRIAHRALQIDWIETRPVRKARQ
ncbi:nuclear transport factor 2 family protein [Actinomadura algeriensis]|uniref:Ketosteroid isomerase-like protein n=1 Tax=Actinomadura algeriensis TaxID=1679523 RepID=A0ABR9JJW5_9ACTN|nr:nuclear transport factor 2 family protein [Actinomadura algeriensis]MBE1530844.1 ketosteroid isomerase-like protein [Actinomadura algeriensis]